MLKLSKANSFVLLTLFSLLLCFLFWMTIAPTQLGGPVTYVIIDGNSMEPGFYLDDLVLVREQQVYGTGDAVVYKDPNMGSYVFHRIIGMEPNRFILQGDNNSWLDSYQPAQEEIVGKLWVHIPKLGKAIEWMRVPLNMSLTVGLLGVVLMFDLFKKPPQNKKTKAMPSTNLGGMLPISIYGLSLFALLFLIFGIYSFTRPLNLPVQSVPYQQEGYFTYSATGTPGVYDTDVIRSGEPVFPKLACYLNIGLTYNILSEHLQGISGKQAMYARILDPQSGWQRTIPLTTETVFSGNSYVTNTTLDLCQVESMVNLVEQEAGLKQMSYTLEIVSDVSFTANMAGTIVKDSFSPKLVFIYDKIHFYLAEDGSQVDPLHATKAGMASTSVSEKNTISLFGIQLPVALMRFLSLIGFSTSLVGLLYIGMNMYRNTSQNQQSLIRLKYGAMIVDVHEQNLAPASSVIDVNTIDDLARLAERHSTMILHMPRNFLHFYFVQSNSTSYRFVVSEGNQGIPAEDNLPKPEIVTPVEPIKKNTIQPESTKPAEEQSEQKPRIVYIYQPSFESTQPVTSKPIERKISNQKSFANEAFEYVINSGKIEYDLLSEDATVLPKIRF